MSDDKDRAVTALRLHQAYKTVFESPEGRLIMADLEARGFFMASSFATMPGRTEFNEGRRSMVLHCKQMADERKFARLTEEVQNG